MLKKACLSIKGVGNFEPCPLSADNLILAGTQIKNTKDLFCTCVYAGSETKMSLNSQISKSKFSTIERTYNSYVLFFLFVLFIELVLFTILSMTYSVYWKREDGLAAVSHALHFRSSASANVEEEEEVHWYLFPPGRQREHTFNDGFLMFVTWLVLLQIIPISLYVTLELQKVLLR